MSNAEDKDIKPQNIDTETPKEDAAKKAVAKEAEEQRQRENDEQTAEHIKEALRETAREDERPRSDKMSLRKIIGGDILNAQYIRSQVWLMLMIAAITVVYVASRYSCQQDMIEMDKLNDQLKAAKYRALSSTSALTEQSRESIILQKLKKNRDTLLMINQEPPFIVETDE